MIWHYFANIIFWLALLLLYSAGVWHGRRIGYRAGALYALREVQEILDEAKRKYP